MGRLLRKPLSNSFPNLYRQGLLWFFSPRNAATA